MVPPTFLANEFAYKQYLEYGAAGNLSFPDYDLDSNGGIIVLAGEAYCRMNDCIVGKSAKDTRNLRAHIANAHGVAISKTRTGNISLPERQAARDLRASEEQEHQQHKNQQQEEEEGEERGEDGEQEEREEGEGKERGEGLPPIPLTALGKISKANTRRALIAAGHTSHGGFPCAGCAASRSPNSCPTNPHVCDFHRHFDVAACVSYQ